MTIKEDDHTSKLLRTIAATNDAKTVGHDIIFIEAARRCDSYADLKLAVSSYLSEWDNPVPDYILRRQLRDQLRRLIDAPAEPPPRRR